MPHPLIIVSGPACAGKRTLAQHLHNEFPELKRIVTYTTREPRTGESMGVDYIFTTRDRFEEMERNREFVETISPNDDERFGTRAEDLRASLNAGPTLLILNPKGADAIHKLFPNAHFIFVVAPEDDTNRRLPYSCSSNGDRAERERVILADTLSVRNGYYSCIINNADGELARSMRQLKRFAYSILKT